MGRRLRRRNISAYKLSWNWRVIGKNILQRKNNFDKKLKNKSQVLFHRKFGNNFSRIGENDG